MMRCTVVLLGVGAFFVACGNAPTSEPGTPSTSGAAVSFSLPSDSGDLVTVPVPGVTSTVLDFFGPTCEPCAKKVPELVRHRADLEKRGARLLLVAVLGDGESGADAERALARWGVRSAFLIDRGGVSLREAGVKDLPSTLIVDQGGRMRWRAPPGATAEDVLRAMP